MNRSDRKLIFITSAVLIGAGLFFASVLVFATRTTSPNRADGPLYVGPKSDIVLKLDEGSPLYFANPFGGRGFWMDRESGELVALDVGTYADPDCSIRWRGRVDSYVDCDGNRLTKADMARHPVEVKTSGKQKGGVFVDLEALDPPSGATSSTTSAAG